MPTWISDTLHNPRAYLLMAALVTAGFGIYDRVVTPEAGILAAIGAMSAYFLASSVVSHGDSVVQAATITAQASPPVSTPVVSIATGQTLPPHG